MRGRKEDATKNCIKHNPSASLLPLESPHLAEGAWDRSSSVRRGMPSKGKRARTLSPARPRPRLDTVLKPRCLILAACSPQLAPETKSFSRLGLHQKPPFYYSYISRALHFLVPLCTFAATCLTSNGNLLSRCLVDCWYTMFCPDRSPAYLSLSLALSLSRSLVLSFSLSTGATARRT